jgi:DNA-3-methyladenine glycosylase II
VIDRVGDCRLRPARDRFQLLVRSIVSQQISTSAARTIHGRIEQLAAPGPLTPKSLLAIGHDKLRAAGASPQKAGYLLDLAAKADGGAVRLSTLGRLDDEQVVAELIQVKGIGRWTAQMFLIFGLGRLDVFPHDDLGVRSALKSLHQLPDLPDKADSHRLAEAWRPFATIGSWYCWRSLEKVV